MILYNGVIENLENRVVKGIEGNIYKNMRYTVKDSNMPKSYCDSLIRCLVNKDLLAKEESTEMFSLVFEDIEEKGKLISDRVIFIEDKLKIEKQKHQVISLKHLDSKDITSLCIDEDKGTLQSKYELEESIRLKNVQVFDKIPSRYDWIC